MTDIYTATHVVCAVSYRGDRVQYGICGGQSDTGFDFFQVSSIFPPVIIPPILNTYLRLNVTLIRRPSLCRKTILLGEERFLRVQSVKNKQFGFSTCCFLRRVVPYFYSDFKTVYLHLKPLFLLNISGFILKLWLLLVSQ